MRFTSCSITLISILAVSTAAYANPLTVPGTSNPWFAGATNGTADAASDNAPANSPVLVTNLTIVPGHLLTFRATGSVDTSGNPPFYPPDGGGIIHHGLSPDGSENGIAGVTAPVDALLGVFLDDAQPVLSAIPSALDFTTPESQNYATLAPALKQVFFIGDGTNGVGALQRVTVPGGATRLFLGGMDGAGWYNNTGSFSVLVSDIGSAGPIITAIRILNQTNVVLNATGGTANHEVIVQTSTNDVLVQTSTNVTNILTFQATGLVSFTSVTPSDPPDGYVPNMVHHNPENGIAGVTAPVDALLGVFLDNSQPDPSAVPSGLDFTTPESQNYAMLSPALKQVFLVGDGTDGAGAHQQVTVPDGATRLFLGTMDGAGWYNNSGSFSVIVSAPVSAVPATVPGTSNPWFAGATNGTADAASDNAPANSPVLVTNLTIVPGHLLTFQATGSVDTSGNPPFYPPDGGGIIHHGLSPDGSENGTAGVTAPVDALLGVFLDDAQPVLSAIPSALDFTTSESQNYATLAPALKQVFFIGDGTNGVGALQRVTVPGGATRLFLGGMDGAGWYNNTGSFSVLVSDIGSVGPTTVPGTSNPWLAGATNGTPAVGGDTAPEESPVLITNIALPTSKWSHFTTRNFDSAGFLGLTNAIPAGERKRFFRLIYTN